jgi:guanylate kinase
VIVVSGPSGVGKTSVVSRVVAELPGLRFSVSHTTRPPRAGEEDGREYYFVDEDRFARMVAEGRFLEWAPVHGRRYGTSRREYELAEQDGLDLVLDVDVQGAVQIRSALPQAVTVFIVPPSYADLEARLQGRHPGNGDVIGPRLRAAVEELRLFREYRYAIVNHDLEVSVLELKAIIQASRCRTSVRQAAVEAVLSTFKKES